MHNPGIGDLVCYRTNRGNDVGFVIEKKSANGARNIVDDAWVYYIYSDKAKKGPFFGSEIKLVQHHGSINSSIEE